MKLENAAIETLIQTEIEPYLASFAAKKDNQSHLMVRIGFDRLATIDRHYGRKEYLLFPTLEQHGITAPPKVMWGVDDEIRAEIKAVIQLLGALEIDHSTIRAES
ncbi:MAG: hemerythrin domain-containing protein [Bacillus subtilis]|nr:hemerythrin domain-containing protein [Bacillus subtilis]